MTENLNLHTVTTVDTRPFRKLVMTIGELPTSFIESMTFYELLAWFTNYLETVIIPTVNNNGEAVEELQEKYIELKTNTEEEITDFENSTNTEIERFEADLTALFNQLKDYVDHYFDNLDVQEEINNKLDDMAEAGTLQEIITQYINATALWMFDNVAAMKLATNFVNGSYAKTLGFYTKNDEGGAFYKIRTKTIDDTADEMTLIDLYDNTLIAELVKTNVMNVKQFGAKGDGTTDDTAVIQKAFDYVKNVNIPAGTYMIDAETTLLPNSGNKIKLDNNATLKAITNNVDEYRVIHLVNVTDVEISGGTIEGDRLTHTGSSGEWGMCIRAAGSCDNIYIHDINLLNAWGDGLTVVITGSIFTERVHVKNARRNGYSIAEAATFISNDDLIEDTNGTNPQCGVDIEPDLGEHYLKNIVFNNLTTKNNAAAGMQLYLTKANSVLTNITINNYYSEGDYRGMWLASSTHKGTVTINNPRIEELSGNNGIYIHPGDVSVEYKIIRPFIRHYKTNTSSVYGIVFNGMSSDISTKGNVTIFQPTIIEPVGTAAASANWAIGFQSASGTWDKIKIIDPINLDGRKIRLGGTMGDDVVIKDNYECCIGNSDANVSLSADVLNSIYYGSAYTANHFVNVSDSTSFPVGYEATFINDSDYVMSVRFPNQFIYPLSSTAGKYILLNDKGASMKIKYLGNATWCAVNTNGNVTTN